MSRNVEHLVEEQILRWQKLREAGDERAVERPSPPYPCVAFAPEVGSLGDRIAATVASRLGVELYGRELVERIAQTAHVRKYLVESVDEHTRNAIETWVGRQLGNSFFAESDYLENLSKVLLTISRHGSAVVIGRGGPFILDPAFTLRVRVIAPLELRAARVAEREHIAENEARSKVLRVDSERAAFVRRHFDRDVTDPKLYDLLLSTERLSLEACTDLVVSAFEARFGGEAPTPRAFA